MKKYKLILLLIILFTFLIRIPSLFEPLYYGDECIYITLGQAFNKGFVFYKRIFDHKPPLIFLTTALAQGKITYFRAFGLIWNLINVYLVYKVGEMLVKKQRKTAGLIAAFLFAVFSFLPEGWVSNGELFMIMPATLGLYLALKAEKLQKPNLWAWVGLSFSIAFLYKPPIALEFAGLCLAFFLYRKKSIKEFLSIFKNKKIYLLLIGFFTPILVSIIYYWFHGAAEPYIRSALLQNIGYISSWSGDTSSGSELYYRALILLASLIAVYIFRKKLGFKFYLILLMALMGGFGVFLSERPYPHYLIQVTPWIALLITQILFNHKLVQITGGLFFIGLMSWGVFKYEFWWYPVAPYYKNFYSFAVGKKNRQQYFDYFENKTHLEYQMARYIRSITNPKENIFVWSNSSSCIYALTDRLPPGKYVTDFHITDFNGIKETTQDLNNNPPKLIITDTEEHREFEQLDKLLLTGYSQIKEFDNFTIYKRKPWLKTSNN